MKDDIRKNFSKGSKTYDDNANVQKTMIDHLISKLPQKSYTKILEIGCGTGLLTTRLVELFPNAKITALDISEGMIATCKEKLKDHNNIEYICADVEYNCPIDEFDLIISSATFQWITDLEELLKKLKSRLSFEGVLAFSTFADKTFKELDKSLDYAFSKNNIDTKTNRNYFSKDDLKEIVDTTFKTSNFNNEIEHLKYTEYFKNALKFLKSVKAVGANTNDLAKYINPQITKDLLDYYNDNYSFKDCEKDYLGFVCASYYLLFVIIEQY
ncbi:malonyl-ACP O-methyltransferase BioC [uncultured Clostridium sp.]|uniref:malonyl-ACP O-methyltransferase BioC n=1 Tax=uncultured Clostridium sp. TaxID=59620 RepID=UPI00261AEA91|nr:malonyl-ACP O-methyltransferase BioC [uncultured Clostridium sp.]